MRGYEKIHFHPSVRDDIVAFDGSVRKYIYKALQRIQENPDIGKALGNSGGRKLASLYAVKLRKQGVRIVYQKLQTSEIVALVVAVGPREKHKVYERAAARIQPG